MSDAPPTAPTPEEIPEEIKGIPYKHYCLLHSAAHVMATAVRRLWPETKFTVGPPISRPYRGFYYDFDLEHRIGPEDLPKIEAEMKKIVKEKQPFERKVLGKTEALELFGGLGQDHKLELIEAKAGTALGARQEASEQGVEGDVVTTYTNGDFVDLCKGPHVEHTGACRFFKLLNISGSYLWGDSQNKQIQRIYGVCWPTKEELKKDVARHDSAVERDHRKIGRDLKLFQSHPEAPGTVFWLHRGTVLFNILSQKMRELLLDNDYNEVRTPLLYNKSLWETSGHWEKFRDKLYTFGDEEEQLFSLKPMNCPAHMLIYRSERRSYRELPLRIHDQGVLHRKEDSGAIEGIRRTYSFCQDDGHIFLKPDQVEDEIAKVIELIKRVYSAFDIDFRCYLSVSDWEHHPERWLGDRAIWEQAEADLAGALEKNDLEYKRDPNEAAFYGPKIDFIIPNIFGEFEHQCATIQLDFNLPERFDLIFVDSDNSEKRPIVVHRAIYGSFERFIASIIEHTAGKFPMWLAPVQAKVLTISEGTVPYGREVHARLCEAGVRAELDDRDDKISFKIRGASREKIPYLLILGAQEAEGGTVSVRSREAQKEQTVMKLEEFIEKARGESVMTF